MRTSLPLLPRFPTPTEPLLLSSHLRLLLRQSEIAHPQGCSVLLSAGTMKNRQLGGWLCPRPPSPFTLVFIFWKEGKRAKSRGRGYRLVPLAPEGWMLTGSLAGGLVGLFTMGCSDSPPPYTRVCSYEPPTLPVHRMVFSPAFQV